MKVCTVKVRKRMKVMKEADEKKNSAEWNGRNLTAAHSHQLTRSGGSQETGTQYTTALSKSTLIL
jgi:hypothetical protein